uniref:carbohydrate ABC transporter permease n=1 Tax=Tessaracoccus timonensis TaxID=2161816 RepID=UPI0018D5898D|nr:sugar ABC transporter permease [Tessaracoccus timonensis]
MSTETATRHSSPKQQMSAKERSLKRLGLLMAAPAIVYILVFMTFPLIYNAYLSLTDANGANLITGNMAFNNFENYIQTFKDPGFYNAILLSLIFTIACLVTQYIIGFALAIFFRRPFPGNGPIRALLLVGWILPPVVTGTIFKWMFDSDYGVINYFLQSLGLIDQPIRWLTVGTTAMAAVIIANLWVGIPFNMLLLLSGLHTIDDSLYEAASVDGAVRWKQFWHITFPMMKPVTISVLLLGVINTYKVFDLIYTMTRGGPVDSTTTLPVYTYLKTFSVFEFGNGAAASMLTLVLPLALSWFYVKSLDEEEF